MARERHYHADRAGDCVVAIHMSLQGLEDMLYMLPQDDQFTRDLWKLWGELDAATAPTTEQNTDAV